MLINHSRSFEAFTREQFHRKCLSYLSLISVWQLVNSMLQSYLPRTNAFTNPLRFSPFWSGDITPRQVAWKLVHVMAWCPIVFNSIDPSLMISCGINGSYTVKCSRYESRQFVWKYSQRHIRCCHCLPPGSFHVLWGLWVTFIKTYLR